MRAVFPRLRQQWRSCNLSFSINPMSESPPIQPENMSLRGRRRAARRRRAGWWIVSAIVLTVVVFGAKPLYHFLKAKRAAQFADSADALAQAGKLSDAARQYRAALQLDPLGYGALAGAARLASRVNRPEAIDLWEQVVKSPRSTFEDRQEYAELLIR